MLSWIGAIFGGINTISSTINGITAAISNEKIALITAKTEQEKAEIQGRIDALTVQLNAQQAVLVADSKVSKIDIVMRTCFAICALAPVFKILVWDKTFGPFIGCVGNRPVAVRFFNSCGSFNTDKLSELDVWIICTCIGFYFLATAFGKK